MSAIREWYGLYSLIYNFMEDEFGYEALVDYWRYIGEKVYSDEADRFRTGGMPYIRDYFKSRIEVDDGIATFDVDEHHVVVDIQKCPDYIWQKYFDVNGFTLPRPHYFRVYEVIYAMVAEKAGLDFSMLRYDETGKLKFEFRKPEGRTAI
ncbi:MAG: hypothetical protein RRZ24_06145 [Clostridia bacterium]